MSQLVWPNGNKYVGQVQNGKPHGSGELTCSNGVKYAVDVFYDEDRYENIFSGHIFSSGQLAQLNIDTGETKIKDYSLILDTKNDFVIQHQRNSHCNGMIKWSNGCFYKGQIQYDKPTGKGDFYDESNKKAIQYIDEVPSSDDYKTYQYFYFLKTGIFGYLSWNRHEIVFEPYQISFSNTDEYKSQYQHPCLGTISWSNGISCQGDIINNKILCKCVYSDQSHIKHELHIFRKWAYFINSGKFGKFDEQTGKIELQPFSLLFNDKDSYVNQHDFDNKNQSIGSFGSVQWPNKCVFHGKILNNKIYDGNLSLLDGKQISILANTLNGKGKGFNTANICVVDLRDKQTGKEIQFDMSKGELL